MNKEYEKIGLYDHNIASYKKVKEAFQNNDVVAIVHATGTGKSYNALQLAYDNQDKKILYIVPSNGIIEHLKSIIKNNPNINEQDLSNLEFRTYQSFINMDRNEIESLNAQMLIIDEFHHIGAPVWGSRINTIIETHPNIKVFGMSAYTIRDRGTQYERDMANPDTNELFSNKIVSKYDLCDAMIDGVLPKPIYKSAYINLIETQKILEEKLKTINPEKKEYKECEKLLKDLKRRIADAPSISHVIKENLKPDGKYIYFCPQQSEENVNDMQTIINEAKTWFSDMGISEKDIIIYQTTSEMGKEGKENREAFYNDTDLNGQNVSNKLRVMFAINQYNEGVHVPNIDGVIMGRTTSSDIVYFEQLGRALAVKGTTKEKLLEYEKYSLEELKEICKTRNIKIDENEQKEEIINKLLAPIIIDLTNNFDYIKELENNLKNRIKEIKAKNTTSSEKREIKIQNTSFDIEITNQNLFEMLKYVRDRLSYSWNDIYEYAKKYYEVHGNLEVPYNFKTNNGYEHDENGTINLGRWIRTQRSNLTPNTERYELLSKLNMRFNRKNLLWEETYEYAKKYFEVHGNLEVPFNFRTNNGYEHDENGTINLGRWIRTQRSNLTPNTERYELLSKLNMRFNRKNLLWEETYEYAKKYFEVHGNLEVPFNFRTNNGYEYDENGTINLGNWIRNQRNKLTPNTEKYELLLKLNMKFDKKNPWYELYELAKNYYKKYGNLYVPENFRTNNGYEYDKDGKRLDQWLYYQKHNYYLDDKKRKLLEEIGIKIEIPVKKINWYDMYELAKNYYKKYGNLYVPENFRTNNGYEYDKDGKRLDQWLYYQKHNYYLDDKKRKLLEEIGIKIEIPVKKTNWYDMYEYAKIYYETHGNLEVPIDFKTNNGYEHDDSGSVELGLWVAKQRKTLAHNSPKAEMLEKIGLFFPKRSIPHEQGYKLLKKYYETHGNLEIPLDFKTKNGYEYDENGLKLGKWLAKQIDYYSSSNSKKDKWLEEFDIVLPKRKLKWEEMYEYAKIYYETHGNLEVPIDFKTNNGYEHDDSGSVELGLWVAKQRKTLAHNSPKAEMLEKIGLFFPKRSINMMQGYRLLKKYYEVYGNIDVPIDFKTNNGYEYDENGLKLGKWLNSNEGKKIKEIAVTFSNEKLAWEEKYEYAKKYYETYGNLNVHLDFKTNNGYEYDENGKIKLGQWVYKQRKTILPNSKEGELLQKIGMTFGRKK